MAPDNDDVYGLAPEPKPAIKPPTAPAHPSAHPPSAHPLRAEPGASAVAARVIQYQRNPRSDTFDPDRLRNLLAPLTLIIAGLLIQIVLVWSQSQFATLAGAVTQVTVELLVGSVVMLVVFRWCAAHRGFDFGSWGNALLKVMAISTAPSAAIDLLTTILTAGPFSAFYAISILLVIAAWIAGFCFYFALIGYFFELDQDDTWFCVIIMFLIGVAATVTSTFMAA